jgi:hypothetical protein
MISIQCFKGLPLDYESFLVGKYDSYITTCHYIDIYYPDYDINYMLVYENNILIELLVYGNYRNTTYCFNSLVDIDQKIIEEFKKNIFNKYPSIKKINIDASYINYGINKSILTFRSNDHILKLPETMDEYFSKLSSSTRQTFKNRKVRLLRDYPQVNFVTKYGKEIDTDLITNILLLNNHKMDLKGIPNRLHTIYKNNIYKYSQYYGCVAYMEIDGQLVAGSINTQLNKGIFGHVTAYDVNFSKYNVGEICAFYLIQTSIENGLSSFHFLWGKNDLKKRLLGKEYLLYSYLIFRTYSFGYYFTNAKILVIYILNKFKQSRMSLPLRTVIKYFYRSSKLKSI